MNILAIAILTFSFTLVGCGTEQKRGGANDEKQNLPDGDGINDKTGIPAGQDTVTEEQIMADEELLGEAISSQIDDAISSLAEDEVQQSDQISLFLANAEGHAKRFRSCEESGDLAIVKVKRDYTRSWQAGQLRKVDVEISLSDEQTRTWSKDDTTITCNESGKWVDLPLLEMSGVFVENNFKRSRTVVREFTNLKGKTYTRSGSMEVEGVRQFKVDSIEQQSDGAPYLIKRTHSKKVERRTQGTDKSGSQRIFSHTIETATEAPLKIEVERDKTTLATNSRTIVSGIVIATNKEGGHVDTTFDNVKWEGENCMPVSGTLSGEIFKANETVAALTFEISFDGDSKTVLFSDGREYEYTPEGCDLEAPRDFAETETAEEV